MQQGMARNALVVSALILSACTKSQAVAEVDGQCADPYQGHVCTWSKAQGKDVVEVGVRVPLAAIENAPTDEQMAWPPVPVADLQLPDSGQRSSGLTHFTMFWEPMGHPPTVFMTPHFDFHFYLIPAAERTTIDCSDLSKPNALPAGYVLPDMELPPPMAQLTGVSTLVGVCVPQMGMHSLIGTEMEGQTPFRGTMVVGYYRGKAIFIEPMLTRAMLLEKKSFDLPIPAIPGFEGTYPRVFHAEYDAPSNAYRFVFSDFRSGA
jgi:hypothetical protein